MVNRHRGKLSVLLVTGEMLIKGDKLFSYQNLQRLKNIYIWPLNNMGD